MFSAAKKLRKRARDYADMARKIINYRKDVLPAEALAELEGVWSQAREMADERKLTPERLGEAEGEWDPVLRRHGGRIYPKTFWSDNVETFMVAAIVVLGIRAFFLQPFIIPTNSMYPTYSGMVHRIYEQEERPNLLLKPLRFVFLGARHREVVAESSGRVRIPFQLVSDARGKTSVRALYELVDARKWLVIPTKNKRYPVFVGDRAAYFDVPTDFDADTVLLDRFYPEARSWSDVLEAERVTGRLRMESGGRGWLTPPGPDYEVGETVLSFDILSGDALFVDRFTYHFFPPETGDPIVFRTGGIKGPRGSLGDKYYIKRLAGTGGQTLAISEPVLFNNGEPADQAEAFVNNNEEKDGYGGYVAGWPGMRYLDPGTVFEVPEDHFFALGDNSRNSQDSRYWGSFDEKRVIGRALFIYYPFTRRWGPAE